MCLALLALHAHPRYAVVIAANRDEFHARPGEAAGWWEDGWLAGRDLGAGGTWLGVTRAGRWALLTNVREPARNDPQAPSRGALVTGFLAGSGAPGETLRAVVAAGHRHNGFNMLAGDVTGAYWGSNRGEASRPLVPGIYGLSNDLLDTPWPKVLRTKAALAAWCAADGLREGGIAPLFGILGDAARAADADLPATGIPLDTERLLSAPFIVSDSYGTRCSTVLTIGYDAAVRFVERSFDPAGRANGEVEYRFRMTATR